MNRAWKLTAPLSLLLVLGCGPSQEDIDAQVDQAVNEALEAAAEESEQAQRPNPTEITAMDIGQHLIDHLEGADLAMPSRYFSPMNCEPLELGSALYGNAHSECNRAIELGDVAVVEYATVLTAERVEEKPDEEKLPGLDVRLGPRVFADRFMLRWDGCDGQTWSRGDCDYLVENGTVAESERLFLEFLGA